MKNNIIQLTHNKDFILLKNNTPKKDSTLKKDNSHKTLTNNNIKELTHKIHKKNKL